MLLLDFIYQLKFLDQIIFFFMILKSISSVWFFLCVNSILIILIS